MSVQPIAAAACPRCVTSISVLGWRGTFGDIWRLTGARKPVMLHGIGIRWDVMKLESIHIKDFRGLTELELSFHPRLTVLVGENGIGKTTILDALAILLDQYLARYVRASPQSARKIKEDDYRIFTWSAHLEVSVKVESETALTWNLSAQKRAAKLNNPLRSDLTDLNEYVKDREKSKANHLTGEPLLIYYGQRRAVLDIPKRLQDDGEMEPIAAFHRALGEEGGLDFRRFVAWFRDQSLLEAQQWQKHPRFRDVQLESVRQAMTRFTPFSDPFYRMEQPRGLCINKAAHRPPDFIEMDLGLDAFDILRVDQLSSGEKMFLALAGDLARRLALLNPDSDDPLSGEGIVLIDEVELHLHPKWQRQFIPRLTETFPNCQFVVTTHSPQVLGEVHAENIRVLRTDPDGTIQAKIPDASYGWDSNYLLLSVLGADERDTGLKQELDDLDKAIGEGRLEDAATALADLRKKMEGEPPELTIAQARIERRQRRPRE
ncbi:MAG: AAA family ATPase [Rhodospirillaceae bacterium]